jgi:hypothetical protein
VLSAHLPHLLFDNSFHTSFCMMHSFFVFTFIFYYIRSRRPRRPPLMASHPQLIPESAAAAHQSNPAATAHLPAPVPGPSAGHTASVLPPFQAALQPPTSQDITAQNSHTSVQNSHASALNSHASVAVDPSAFPAAPEQTQMPYAVKTGKFSVANICPSIGVCPTTGQGSGSSSAAYLSPPQESSLSNSGIRSPEGRALTSSETQLIRHLLYMQTGQYIFGQTTCGPGTNTG